MGGELRKISYNTRVTPEELWRVVGEVLLVQRNRLDWNHSDVERHGGPNAKTVKKTEQGNPGRLRELTMHAEALGLSIVDVLRAALDASKSELSSGAYELVRHYERTSEDGRFALLITGRALPDGGAEAQQTGHQPPRGRPGGGRSTP